MVESLVPGKISAIIFIYSNFKYKQTLIYPTCMLGLSSSVFWPRAGASLQTQALKAAIMPKGRSSIANSGT